MTENVKVNIDVTDNGSTAKVDKEVQKLNKSLQAAAKAEKRVPLAVQAAQQGVAASAAASSNIGAFGASAPSTKASGVARSIGTGTGAESRDFAKQAAGLGGLVRVYATFAANIFAATAAFTALSKAADVSNLSKGLDQLGASSGRSLGTLAKQLTLVTDGAISFREALTATAQASAGGLTSANILRLGQVAKQASQALGVAMPDAVSRLSRGITKLEPELLDEIGIMVRVDKAAADYARSIGKTASSLTDFEKRQGFANAVLEQGEKKFGAINLDANPYAKIQASMENLAFTGLNLINKVLSPLLSVLSSSPAALGVAMTGIATILLKQAIPAIGQWRQGLETAAKSARELVVATNAQRKDLQFRKDEVEIDKLTNAELRAQKVAVDALAAAKVAAAKKTITAGNAKLIPEASETVDKTNLIALEKRAALLVSQSTMEDRYTEKTIARKKAEVLLINNVTAALRAQLLAEEALNKEINLPRKNVVTRFFAEGAQQERIADRAAAKSQRTDITSSVIQGVPIKGLTESYKELNKQIALARLGFDAQGVAFADGQKNMTAFNAGLTRTVTIAALAAGAIGTLVNSLNGVLVAVTILFGVFQILDSIFSKANKQAEAFSTSLEILEGASDNVVKTLDSIKNKSAESILSAESIQARAAAFGDLSDAVKKASLDFNALQASSGGFDKFKDAFKDFFGFGSADKLSTQLAAAITNTLKVVEEGPAKEKAQDTLNAIFGNKIDLTNFKELEAALRDLDNTELSVKAQEASKALQDLSRQAGNAAGAVSAAKVSFGETSKILNDIGTSLKLTDNLAKLGSQAITASNEFATALKDPVNGLVVLRDLIDDVGTLSLLPDDTISDLRTAKSQINETVTALGIYRTSLVSLQEEQKKLDKQVAERGGADSLKVQTGGKKLLADQANTTSAIANLKAAISAAEKASTNLIDAFGTTVNRQLFEAGAKKLYDSLKGALQEGAITAANGYLSVIKGAGGSTAEQDTKLQLQQIDLQITAIKQNFELIKRITAQTVATEALTIQNQILAAQEDAKSSSDERRTRALLDLPKLLEARAINERKQSLLGTSNREALNQYASSASGTKVDIAAASQLKTYFESLFGQEGQLAKLIGQSAAVRIQGKANLIQENTGKATAALDQSSASKSAQSAALGQQQAQLGFYNEELSAAKNLLDVEILQNSSAKERLESESKLARLKLVQAEAGGNTDKLRADIAREQTKLFEQTERNALAEDTLNASRQLEKLNGLEAVRQKESEVALKRLDLLQEITKAELSAQESRLAYSASLGSFDDAELARQRAGLEVSKQQLDYEKQVAQAKADTLTAVNAIDIKLQSPANTSAAAQLQKEKAAIQENAALQLQGINRNNEAKLLSISLTEKQNIALAQQAEFTKNIADLSFSLGEAFGKMGESVGKVTELLGNMAVNELKYLEQRNNLAEREKEIKKSGVDPEQQQKELLALSQQQAKLENKQNKEQIQGLVSVAGATKNLFKEKTFAYKAFSAVEKGLHILSVAMAVKDIAVDTAKTGTAVANSGLRSAAKGIEAVLTTLASIPFPANVIAGAAVAAIVSKLIGGSKVSGVSGGSTAGEQQSVQGTGQSFNSSGNIEKRAGGVLGDDTAIAKSIDTNIKLLEEHGFKNLEFSNKMLISLKAIKTNTDGLAQILIQAGLTVANPTIQTGQLKGGNLTTAQVDPLKNALFGGGAGTKAGDALLSSIFGGKQTAEIKDTGIAIKGTLGALAEGAAGLVTQYTNIQTTTKGGLFSSDKVDNSVIIDPLKRQANEYIQGIFGNIRNTLIEAGDALGKDKVVTSNILDSLNLVLKISAQGLKPDELAAAINGEISVAFNQAAEAAFPELAKFRALGEEMGTTVVRLARDSQLTTLALSSIGKALGPLGEVAKVDVVENLIKLSGGIDNFLTTTEDYKSNFLTAAEQLIPVQAAVTKEMARLGLASVDTREEFASVVNGLDLTKPAAQQLYADLMNVSGAFAEVYAETRKSLSVEELRKSLLSQQIEILKLEGKATQALALTRAEELANLDPALKAGQEYIYQLTDRLSAIKAESSLLAAMGYTYKALLIDRELELRTLTDAEKLTKIKIYAAQDEAKTQELLVQLLEATGDATGALNAKRQLEIRGLSQADAAIKSRIFRLQDEAALKAKLKTAYDKEAAAIKTTISGLKDSVKALNTYKEALKIADKSTLTPLQKYEETKAQAQRIAQLANSIAVTDAEKSDKQAAINELPAATDAFLEASRIIYASSEQYTRDFNTVLDLIGSTGAILESQQTDAERQLAALDSSVSFLGIIQENTQTTAEILSQLLVLQSTMYTADVAASAMAAANANVLPELIVQQMTAGIEAIFTTLFNNATTPSTGVVSQYNTPIVPDTTIGDPNIIRDRATSATVVATETANALLVAEITALRAEVSGLRADQQIQTGHLIQTNYEATQQLIAAQKALTELQAANDAWNTRNSIFENNISMGA